MLLGALLDAGAPLDDVRSAVAALGAEPIDIVTRAVTRQGVSATKVDIRAPGPGVARGWPDLRALLYRADLPEPVRARALDAFARLARAEAAAHGTSPENVRFHEVGALDALADVVGACAALHSLGITEVTSSPVALGSGVTRGRHGPLPVPGPAVLELLREAGAPVWTSELPYELCTPTGAALLAATVTRWGGMPLLRIHATGAGAGSRDPAELANVLRAVLGAPLPEAAEAHGGDEGLLVLETNVDDLDPRLWPAVLDRLLAAGAADAWLTPITMKKGRPGHTLSVLVDPLRAQSARRLVFTETSTLGIRERAVDRTVLDRATAKVEVGGHRVRVKLAYLDGAPVGAQPEYDDVAEAAAGLGRPVRDVLAEATAAARWASRDL